MVSVSNLMWQHASLFKWLEVVEVMRSFITQQMANSEELSSNLHGKMVILLSLRRLLRIEPSS